ncbi:hypothetical protein LCGC14_1939300 [marine sediment metagenome]|uniref:Uncharacterized protein n=1 Tax=marine sediment metagenome TaxID=412755 RepID=A0A0F9FL23_9ZZZZ
MTAPPSTNACGEKLRRAPRWLGAYLVAILVATLASFCLGVLHTRVGQVLLAGVFVIGHGMQERMATSLPWLAVWLDAHPIAGLIAVLAYVPLYFAALLLPSALALRVGWPRSVRWLAVQIVFCGFHAACVPMVHELFGP